MITLNDTERAVLEHVVTDPDKWLADAVSTLGEDKARAALEAKVTRWKPVYEAAYANPDYKNRVERDAAEVAETEARRLAKTP